MFIRAGFRQGAAAQPAVKSFLPRLSARQPGERYGIPEHGTD